MQTTLDTKPARLRRRWTAGCALLGTSITSKKPRTVTNNHGLTAVLASVAAVGGREMIGTVNCRLMPSTGRCRFHGGFMLRTSLAASQ